MIHIALTGGIASGKSTVAEAFQTHGVPVIDADEAARTAVLPGSTGLAALIALTGPEILHPDGTLNRGELRQRIFTDPTLRQSVEEVLHPQITEIMLQQAATQQTPYLIFMIPLLTQREGRYPIDRILVVDIPEALQIERVMKRDQIDQQQAEAILQAQPGRQQRLSLADDIITNLDRETLPAQVDALHQQYLQLATGQ